MIYKTCGAENTWTPWTYFDRTFVAGIDTGSFSSTVSLQYCPNSRRETPAAGDIVVPIYTWGSQNADLVEPPKTGGWYRIGVDTGDYTDEVNVFMKG